MHTISRDRAPSPLPPLGHEISRPPSSASTQSSNALTQQQYQTTSSNFNVSLPGLSTLASVASAPSPQLRAYNSIGQAMSYAAASPTPTSVSGQGNTPSRNRIKSAGQGQKKKPLFDGNGQPTSRSEAGSPPPSHRRVSHKSASGDSDLSNSPVSRAPTPPLQHPSNIAPQHMFDHAALTDHVFNHSPSLPAMHLRHPSPGPTLSLTDRHLEPPLSYEVLQQQTTTLKTRVSELEVINDLFRGRVHELEQNDRQLRQALDHSKQQENQLKRRLDDLERENADFRDMNSPPHAKRPRMSGVSEYPDPPQPLGATM
ncbi:hypothetical protein MMC13_008408 [Lambiella insularis]|nr:hypothetical protein [Lambiella insularis]